MHSGLSRILQADPRMRTSRWSFSKNPQFLQFPGNHAEILRHSAAAYCCESSGIRRIKINSCSLIILDSFLTYTDNVGKRKLITYIYIYMHEHSPFSFKGRLLKYPYFRKKTNFLIYQFYPRQLHIFF